MLAEIAPVGSSLYYCFRKLPEQQRQALLVLQAFVEELRKISERFQSYEIAEGKLGWWKTEIERLYDGNPQHPIAQALVPLVEAYRIAQSQLAAIHEAYTLNLQTQLFPTRAALAQHFQHTGGIIEQLKAVVLTPNAKTVEQYNHHLGVALEIARHLYELPYDLKRQHFYFAETDMQAAQLNPEQLHQAVLQPNQMDREHWQQLIASQVALFRDYYQKAQELMPEALKESLWPSRCYTGLQAKWVRLVEKQSVSLLQNQWQLSPLRKYWFSVWYR